MCLLGPCETIAQLLIIRLISDVYYHKINENSLDMFDMLCNILMLPFPELRAFDRSCILHGSKVDHFSENILRIAFSTKEFLCGY